MNFFAAVKKNAGKFLAPVRKSSQRTASRKHAEREKKL